MKKQALKCRRQKLKQLPRNIGVDAERISKHLEQKSLKNLLNEFKIIKKKTSL
jgi:hypothetical protein